MSVLVAVLISVPVTVLLRIVPGVVWRFRGMDAGAHLLLRRHIRQHGMRLTMRDWPLVLDERHTYPWAFHWLIALLPESWLRRLPPLPSAICDGLHVLLVVVLASLLAPRVSTELDPAMVGLVAGLLFGTAPALLVVGFGPRAYEVTPRPFGELLYTVMMMGAVLYLADGRVIGAVLAVVVGGLLLLSSKFGAQVLVFCTPIMALLTLDARILLLAPTAWVAALIMSGGGYWWMCRTQLLHLNHYRRRVQYEHPALAERNRGRDLLHALLGAIRSPRDREAWTSAIRLAEGHTFLQFLLRNVLWCSVALMVALGLSPAWAGAGAAWRTWLLAWAVAPLGPFLVTSLKDFRFLGEAERYPEYALAPVTVLGSIGVLSASADTGLAAAILYGFTLVPAFAYTFLRLRWNARKLPTDELDELIGFLRSLPPSTVLTSLPWHLAFQLAPDVGVRFVAAMDASVWCRDYDEIFASYPWIVPDLARWKEWGATLVIVDRNAMSLSEAPLYDLSGLALELDTGRYQVFGWRP